MKVSQIAFESEKFGEIMVYRDVHTKVFMKITEDADGSDVQILGEVSEAAEALAVMFVQEDVDIGKVPLEKEEGYKRYVRQTLFTLLEWM
jgi:hypothetical protein